MSGRDTAESRNNTIWPLRERISADAILSICSASSRGIRRLNITVSVLIGDGPYHGPLRSQHGKTQFIVIGVRGYTVSMNAPKEKSHDRSPGMVQTSIAIPKTLLEAVSKIAYEQERSRNKVITMLLREKVAEYHAKKGVPHIEPANERAEG